MGTLPTRIGTRIWRVQGAPDLKSAKGSAARRRAGAIVFAACLAGSVAYSQQVALNIMAGATPFGTAAGQTGGFNGSFQASLPLYHIGARGEAGVDLDWNFQPNWQAVEEGPSIVPIDPYPSQNVAGENSNAFALGGVGQV